MTCKKLIRNNLVRLCTYLIVLSMSSCSSPGLRGKGHAQAVKSSERIIAKMTLQLNLTAEQQFRVSSVIEDYTQERDKFIETAKRQGRAGKHSLKEKLKKLDERKTAQLASILSYDQLQKYIAMQELKSSKMSNRKSRGSGKGGGKGRGI